MNTCAFACTCWPMQGIILMTVSKFFYPLPRQQKPRLSRSREDWINYCLTSIYLPLNKNQHDGGWDQRFRQNRTNVSSSLFGERHRSDSLNNLHCTISFNWFFQQVKLINDPFISVDYMIYLFKHDSTHGVFPGTVGCESDSLLINGN